ncbi:cell division protein ZipA C-terminal FtsZ-binding domain-containing protein [Wielerella bovis]|uniref:cell division protein ZipA C-terminal FtsZ-binding domain-containing protein n=1 Tax=Wielerella bovis TaxID=2917790 RepID=UPI0020184EC3|nr:cell division protein ZipA C-terminal FtsZ-binding domain-containing protein [Wielerella bovis]MCG7656201.1 cell division protein ZipA C-terminal FtsZ-binding domain-containing protein [Wielerella bovis]MCG7658426.1 cell division protein ZipA C-terminal FtsZ-binding domain-containing protein [Wielerella bovis]
MNSIYLIIIILLLTVLLAVVAYNMYQENQYRQRIRNQFGHADDDALLDSNTLSVRDGQSLQSSGLRRAAVKTNPTQSEQSDTDAIAELDTRFADTRATEADKQDNSVVEVEEIVQETHDVEETITITATQNDDMVERTLLNELSTHAENQPVFSVIDESPQQTEPQSNSTGSTHVISETTSKIKSLFTSKLVAKTEPKQEELDFAAVPEKFEAVPEPIFAEPVIEPELTQTGQPTLVDVQDLEQSELLWFDKRFDFMGYIALREPKELHAIPRLSGRHRFQIIGCTMDGRFQAAEPIPGVAYQAFVVGLQAISRNGLAEKAELEYFANQVRQFANKMDGVSSTANVDTFLEIARPLDELCARVDQTIALHLVSRATVLGTEIRSAVEKSGFELMPDGTFSLQNINGEPKYTIAALDGSAFTEALLSSQPYKGFSMLFDITRIPDAEADFNGFMTLAVRLSGELGLDLVDDQVRQLSTDWLKEVRTYVGARQHEMNKVGIEPGSNLAKRLFS